MRNMLLSIQTFWKDRIMSSGKVYEYRNRFSIEEIMAHLYVSASVRGVVRILHLEKHILLSEWKEIFKNAPEIFYRIRIYEERKIYLQYQWFYTRNKFVY